MPYIAIKGYPKDEETKRKIVERVNEVFLELWNCPQEAINFGKITEKRERFHNVNVSADDLNQEIISF